MNEVSIIINGVRYDAIYNVGDDFSNDCSFYDEENGCNGCIIGISACMRIIGVNRIFKKNDKKFER